MSILVKICGLTDADAVHAAVQAGADAVGFVFAESVRRVNPAEARTLVADLPGAVLRVAVMLHPADDEWAAVRDVFAPDVLQTDAEDFAALNVPATIRRWPVIREGQAPATLPAEFVYEGQRSGQGQRVDWHKAATAARRGRMILAGGLTADNVGAAIAEVMPFGVDVSSAIESAPGKKDADKIRAFVKAAKAAGKRLRTNA